MLLNNRIVTFNPETIMVQAGKVPQEIYLLLAGKVEILTAGPEQRAFPVQRLDAGRVGGDSQHRAAT
jgi:hypothetical protein